MEWLALFGKVEGKTVAKTSFNDPYFCRCLGGWILDECLEFDGTISLDKLEALATRLQFPEREVYVRRLREFVYSCRENDVQEIVLI